MPRIASSFVPRGCFALILSSGCYSSTDPGSTASDTATSETSGTGGDPAVHEPEGTSLYIKIVAKGVPVPRARVTVHSQKFADPDVSDPSASAPVYEADGAGNLLLEHVNPGAFVAQVDAPGHASAGLVLTLADGMHAGKRVNLLPLAEPVVFDADLGATLEQGDVQLKIPAGAVVDAQGQPVTGPVQVTITPFDPSRQLGELPWPLRGERSAENDGTNVGLKSFYMADISLWRGAERLQLAAGKAAEVEFTLPTGYGDLDLSAVTEVGDEIPSWYFDFEAGIWKEEAMGYVGPAKQAGRLAWSTKLTHFSPHNCDVPVPPPKETCVLVTVFDAEDNPVPDMNVVLKGNMYQDEGITNQDGQVCLMAQVDDPVQVWVGEPDQQLSAVIDVVGEVPDATCPADLKEPGECHEIGIPYDDPKSDDCSPGSSYDCDYTGEPQQEGVGICVAGKIVCDMFHQWREDCEGEILPGDEQCETKEVDEDCDGEPNEAPMGCECDANDPEPPCFPFDDVQIQGKCQAGHRECVNMMWSGCIGAVGPDMMEDCDSAEDENCDGNPGCGLVEDGWNLGDAGSQRAIDVATSNDNIYVLGRTLGGVTVGGGQVVPDVVEHAFLASFKLNGDGVDVIDLGPAWQGDLNLAVNSGGDIVVAGTLASAVPQNIGGCNVPATAGKDIGVLRFVGPVLVCASAPVLSGAGAQGATAVQIDDVGVVFLAGLYSSEVELQLAQKVLPPTLPGERDAFVLRLNAVNEVQWAEPLPSHLPPGDLRAPDLAAAGATVLVAGVFQGTRDFGADTLFSDGNSDVFVTRHDAITGGIVWAKDFGNLADEPGFVSVAIGVDESFVVTGVISGEVSFGPGLQHIAGQLDEPSVFVHKRSLANEPLWTAARSLADPQSLDGGHSVAIDSADRVVLVGTVPGNQADLYTEKFSVTGQTYWDAHYERLGNQYGAAVAFDATDHPIVVGRFDTDFEINGEMINLGDGGDVMDALVLRLQP